MQYLSDDIDELFRRAGENYPLRTDNADWNKVNSSLQSSARKEPKKPRFGKWLFFIPLLIIGVTNTFIGYRQDNSSGKNSLIQSAIKESVINSYTDKIALPSDLVNTSHPLPKQSVVDNKFKIKQVSIQSSVIKENRSYKKDYSRNKSDNSFSNDIFNLAPQVKTHTDGYFGNSFLPKTIDLHFPLPVINRTDIVDHSVNTPLISEDIAHQKIKHNAKHFYAGLITGFDVSTVKFQSVSNTGFTLGALLGYQISQKWSIETGLYYDKKSYYSDGKYFILKAYPNSHVYDVDGICHMIELPLNAKYNFRVGKKGLWFSEAGLSSYLMKKEYYNYSYDWLGQVAYGNKTYNNSTKNWFSVMNISVGYERKIGKLGVLRLEPYAKVPLKGLGIGQLPITSFGLNVGIAKPLF